MLQQSQLRLVSTVHTVYNKPVTSLLSIQSHSNRVKEEYKPVIPCIEAISIPYLSF